MISWLSNVTPGPGLNWIELVILTLIFILISNPLLWSKQPHGGHKAKWNTKYKWWLVWGGKISLCLFCPTSIVDPGHQYFNRSWKPLNSSWAVLVFLNFFSSAEERDSLSKRNPIRNNQGAQGQYFNERLMVLQNIIYAKDILGSGQADSGASSSIFLNSCLVAARSQSGWAETGSPGRLWSPRGRWTLTLRFYGTIYSVTWIMAGRARRKHWSEHL